MRKSRSAAASSSQRSSASSRDGAGARLPGPVAWLVLAGLLVAPALALERLAATVDGRWLAGGAATVSLATFLAYRHDKRAAEAGAERVSEATLHVLALAGGWPGAFLGQRVFRHKTVKASFQVFFWLVVASHQFAAADYLEHGRLSRAVRREVSELLK